jgi:hypothetical protein
MVSFNGLEHVVMRVAFKPLRISNVLGTGGVCGRVSDNQLIGENAKTGGGKTSSRRGSSIPTGEINR